MNVSMTYFLGFDAGPRFLLAGGFFCPAADHQPDLLVHRRQSEGQATGEPNHLRPGTSGIRPRDILQFRPLRCQS